MTPIRKKDLAIRFAECRSLGHQWRTQPLIGMDDRNDRYARPFGMSTGMIGIPSECTNCTKAKVRWITRSGEMITRYVDPEGYATHGDERKTHQEWRQTYVGTLFEQFESAIQSAPKKSNGNVRKRA